MSDKPKPAAIAFRIALRNSELDEMRRVAAAHEDLFDQLTAGHDWIVHEAAKFSTPEALELLIDQGADVNEMDANKSTGLSCAIYCDRPEMVAALLRHGADPNLQSPLCDILIFQDRISEPVQMAKLLVDAGADVNLPHESPGWGTVTPLRFATASDYQQMVDYLVSAGATADDNA